MPFLKDFVICYGWDERLYEEAKSWLKKSLKRRLVFIEEGRSLDVQHPQVKTFSLDSPLQIEPLAKQLAWQAVFLEAELVDKAGSAWFAPFRDHFEECHRAAGLLLSDGAEWGVPFAKHAKKNLKKPFRRALDLEFKGIPAIVVGAGPSLQKNRHLLKEFSTRALILAGGNALKHLPIEPHFGATIDPHEALSHPFPKIPFCFQARAHPDSIRGEELLLVPDSHFSFLNWIADIEGPFNGGWTVGNFLMQLAFCWGCDPIVFVGMDGCYHNGEKYPGQKKKVEGLIEIADGRGNKVWTQRDWVQAARWTEALARSHSDRRWINATEGGVRLGEPIEERKLEEIALVEQGDLHKKVRSAIENLRVGKVRWEEWKEALREKGEQVHELLLDPLWHLWRPIFEREVDVDRHPIPREQKLELHRSLFFQQVIEEHLRV